MHLKKIKAGAHRNQALKLQIDESLIARFYFMSTNISPSKWSALIISCEN